MWSQEYDLFKVVKALNALLRILGNIVNFVSMWLVVCRVYTLESKSNKWEKLKFHPCAMGPILSNRLLSTSYQSKKKTQVFLWFSLMFNTHAHTNTLDKPSHQNFLRYPYALIIPPSTSGINILGKLGRFRKPWPFHDLL